MCPKGNDSRNYSVRYFVLGAPALLSPAELEGFIAEQERRHNAVFIGGDSEKLIFEEVHVLPANDVAVVVAPWQIRLPLQLGEHRLQLPGGKFWGIKPGKFWGESLYPGDEIKLITNGGADLGGGTIVSAGLYTYQAADHIGAVDAFLEAIGMVREEYALYVLEHYDVQLGRDTVVSVFMADLQG